MAVMDELVSDLTCHDAWSTNEKKICLLNSKKDTVFSSLELKAQVSFSDHRLSVHLSICKLFTLRTTGPISTKFGTKRPWVKGILVCSNEGPCLFPRGDNYEIANIYRWNLYNLLQNHEANFNQTWHKASLGEENEGFTNKDHSIL